MVIDKVHGLHSTGISMSERFAMIAETAPVFQPRNRQTAPGTLYQNGRNRQQFGQYRRLEWQQKRHELRQRLGLQRFGSENNLPALRRSGSFGNLSQTSRQGFRNKANWQGSSGNLSPTSSFRTFSQATWKSRLMRRGYQRRGVGKRGSVGRNRGFRQGRMGSNGQRRNFQQGNQGGRGRGGRGRGRGRGWGRGRGGNRNLTSKPVPTREELDKELEQYMASSKSALDRELEAYMSTAVMELE